jgi:hypothetical protein
MAGWRHLIPLSSTLQRGLQQSGLDVPSAIQRAAAPRIFAGESVALHAETGSGKTLAFLAPLLARCKLGVPRQVLVLVPSHQLALQTLDIADALREAGAGGFAGGTGGALPAAELLRSAKPADRSQSLSSQQAEILIATGAQLAALLPTFESHPSAVSQLRSNLTTGVIDEVDAQLQLPASMAGRPSMHRRVARDRYLGRSALGQALRLVLARGRRGGRATLGTAKKGDVKAVGTPTGVQRMGPDFSGWRHAAKPAAKSGRSSFGRVQLVALTATLSHTALRDLLGVVGHEPGRLGLVVAASAGAGNEMLAQAVERARRAKPLPPIGPLPPMPPLYDAVGASGGGGTPVVGEAGEVFDRSGEGGENKTDGSGLYRVLLGAEEEESFEEEEDGFSLGEEVEMGGESAASGAHAGELAPWSLLNPPASVPAGRSETSSPREGYGVRGGVLRVAMPTCISHSVLLCRERAKAAAAAAVLAGKARGSSAIALLVMKDGIDSDDALEELTCAGVAAARSLEDVSAAAAVALGLPAQDEGVTDAAGGEFQTEPARASVGSKGSTARLSAHGAVLAARAREALARLDPAAESQAAAAAQLPEWAILNMTVDRVDDRSSRMRAAATVAKRPPTTEAPGRPTPLGDSLGVGGIGQSLTGEGSSGDWRSEASGGGRIAQGSGALARGIAATGARVIVAHESAVRGLDLPELDLVILMMLPDTPEAYMHIAGRTGRFGKKGHVVNIWTRREQDRSGFVTASLRGVKFKTTEFEPDEVGQGQRDGGEGWEGLESRQPTVGWHDGRQAGRSRAGTD